ncbi:MAG: glucose-6-phosphate isomerase [Clostridia bacterium]|nr:glucose-6-phosphate isomerase [Clostridia bacterium]
MVKFDFKNSSINERMIYEMENVVLENHKKLHDNPDEETDFRGWINLPENYDKVEFERIKKAAAKIQSDSDVLIVIGIGGSYLGARAVIESLTNCFNNMLPAKKRKLPMVVYAGNNLSPNYLNDLLNLIGERDISINVISKSGTTTEPAIAFRVLREAIETKYGVEEAKKRIYVTTDKKRGALKGLADEENYETFVIPDNVGGRFSVLTAVGLLPIATAGINIDKLMQGARDAREKYMDPSIKFNDCYKYAVVRNLLYNSGKKVEVLANYEPQLHYFTEWWKQLYGESEGKDGKGIFPAGVDLTTDLHSMGQYIQDGERILMETVLAVEESNSDIVVKEDAENVDGLNYLAGKGLDYINKKAMEGTIEAHVTGNVPNLKISIDKLDEENLGHLIYFFEKACAMSGLILDVNPFNQPGVEEYKRNMFRLLEKPGYKK